MSSGLRRPLATHVSRSLSFSAARIQSPRARFITSSSRTFNTTGTSSTVVKPKKKRRIIRTTLIYSTLLVASGYALGTTAALNNEQVHDWFTENVPFGEDIVDFAESQGFVGGLPRNVTSSPSPIRRQRPTPSSPADPQPEPPKKHEKMEALKARVDQRVKEKKERLRDIAAQIPTHAEKGEAHGLIPAHISGTGAAPLPPAHYSEGVEALVNEVKGVLKGDPVIFPPESPKVKGDTSPHKEEVKQDSVVEAPAPKAEEKEPAVPPAGKEWYTNEHLPLGFEPPPGYALRPPKKVPKSKAGLLLVAPAVAEFNATEPLLNELATTVDNLAKYLEENPKAERGVNKILEVAKKDLVDLG
ncbi:Formation of crista junctions protein 1, partial [Serendipita sp. 399]